MDGAKFSKTKNSVRAVMKVVDGTRESPPQEVHTRLEDELSVFIYVIDFSFHIHISVCVCVLAARGKRYIDTDIAPSHELGCMSMDSDDVSGHHRSQIL